MFNVKCGLISGLFILFVICASPFANAQNAAPEPVMAVVEESLGAEPAASLEKAPVLLELFSTQACLFCPQAERLFADLIKQENILGLSCHVDYFDVKVNALSHGFCTARQKKYMEQLKAGPQYTPQIVVNGRIDVVGHKFEKIKNAMTRAAPNAPQSITISKGAGNDYTAALPAIDNPQGKPIDLWLFIYDRPYELTVAEGRNRGKKLAFYNIVSDLQSIGRWDGTAQDKAVSVEFKDMNKAFAIIAQDSENGAVLAIGRYRKIQPKAQAPKTVPQAQ